MLAVDPAITSEGNYPLPNSTGRNHIVLDFDSHAAGRDLIESEFRDPFGESERFLDSERDLVVARIDAAARSIKDHLPVQWDFLTCLTRTIIPRRYSKNPTFRGSSNQTEIGRTNLFNPHGPRLTTVPVASSLIHEAIHTYLYTQEHRAPLVTDRSVALDSRIESPWSGKRVNLRALVHATFVWFGLLFTWSSPAVYQHFDEVDIGYFREFCGRGFVHGRYLEVLEPWSKYLRPSVWRELRALDSQVEPEFLPDAP